MRTLYGADKAQRLAARTSFIPKTARLAPGCPAGCAVYLYDRADVLYALGFRGTAGRPEWHHRFRSVEQRQAHIDQFYESVRHAYDSSAKRRAEKRAWTNPLTIGTVMYTSWGYDQTNVDFFVVTRVSGKRVWVAKIAAEYESTGFMSGKTWPAMPIRVVGDETMHVAQPSGDNGASVKINESATAWIETGRTHYSSSYA